MVNILAGVILVWLVIVAILVPILWLSTKLPAFDRIAAAQREIEKDKEKERLRTLRATTGGWDWETFPYIPALVMTLILFGTVAGIGSELIKNGLGSHVSYADRHADHVDIERAIPNLAPLW